MPSAKRAHMVATLPHWMITISSKSLLYAKSFSDSLKFYNYSMTDISHHAASNHLRASQDHAEPSCDIFEKI